MIGLKTCSQLIVFAAAIQAKDPEALVVQATTAYQAKDYSLAAQLFEAAVRAGANAPAVAYSAASCHALLGKTDDAFAWLDRAVAAGWRDVELLKSDADLTPLHADPRWERAVLRCQESRDKFNKSLKEPALREELLKRMKEDQRIRLSSKPSFLGWDKAAEWRRIDADNTAFMKTVIDKYGWPGKSMVGADGALAAFLLVQHADADAAFQKRCLELLIKAVELKDASPSDMAYLTDRVLVAEGKPQRYGTQFHTVNGELQPRPIEDEPNVDGRRKEVGLPPLAEYAEQMRELERP